MKTTAPRAAHAGGQMDEAEMLIELYKHRPKDQNLRQMRSHIFSLMGCYVRLAAPENMAEGRMPPLNEGYRLPRSTGIDLIAVPHGHSAAVKWYLDWMEGKIDSHPCLRNG